MHSKNIQYIPAFDHLRFFASMLIVIFHLANGHIVHYLHFDIGVPLFFSLSGYLFMLIACNNINTEINYRKFIYNRILRIYPLITVLFLMTAVIMDNFVVSDFINLLGLNLPGVARTSWIVGDWGYKSLSFNWWTIGVEFTFYLIFPLLFKIYRTFGVKLIFKLFILILTFKFLLFYSLLEEYGFKKLAICFNYSFFGNFDIFLIGMIAAHYDVFAMQKTFLKNLWIKNIVLLLYVISMWFILVNYIDSVPLPLSAAVSGILCSGLIMIYKITLSNTENNIISKKLSILGSMSFSIYLLHDFIKEGIKGLGLENWIVNSLFNVATIDNEVTKFYMLFFYIPIIILISKFSYNVIEYPFLSMRIKYFTKP